MFRASLAKARHVDRDTAFADFFSEWYHRLAQSLVLLTGNSVDAEDLAQESFARAYERWNRVHLMESPIGYVYATARNLHRNWLRRRTREARRIFMMRGEEPDLSEASANRSEVLRLLGSLSRDQREALILVEWLGLDIGEVAQILGIESVSVRGRLHRAKTKLREQFGDLE